VDGVGSNGIEVQGSGRLQALREMTFPLALRGYARSEVDRFLGETAEWVERLVARGADATVVQHELSRVGEQTAGILSAAEDTARRMRIEAAEDAERTQASTRDHAARVRAEAESYADTTRAEADRYAEATRAEADRHAEVSRKALEEEVRRRKIEASSEVDARLSEAARKADEIVEDALRRRNRLKAATDQLKRTRHEILDDAGSLADELAQVVATHAEVTSNVTGRAEPEAAGAASAERAPESPSGVDPKSLLDD
jgi:DivIVA domain-containing protein